MKRHRVGTSTLSGFLAFRGGSRAGLPERKLKPDRRKKIRATYSAPSLLRNLLGSLFVAFGGALASFDGDDIFVDVHLMNTGERRVRNVYTQREL